jgi:CMP-N-acetylneuraminate monooxygenase
MNFTNIGRLQNKSIINKFKIKISTLDKKINLFENFIIVKIKNKFKIYDRICDHAGGKIISKKNEFVCPLHSWRFDPEKGKYSNGVKKKEILNYVSEGNLIFEVKKQIPKIKKIRIDEEVKIRFINHAFVIISGKNFKFAMDPWAIGPAFNSGWWLRLKTKNDWIKHINNCDFIYTSHNHPDHLNKYTLAHVRKDMQFIVPKYTTDSTGIFIETLGFKNILRLDFKDQFQFKDTNLIISILKSGDFRDDSGIYFSIGNFSCLFDVDTNNINFNNLPKVDLYGSSFAGGASGYPLIFSNYNEKEKKRIINTNKVSLRIFKEKNLKSIKPKYFFPYAGFFSESLNRDSYIYKNNKKNKIEDYEKICKNLKSKILNVEKFDEFYF